MAKVKDKKIVVAYPGIPGAYSHAAALAVFPNAETKGYATFDEAADAVRKGTAAYALLPIENSTAGRVTDMHHVLKKSGVYVIGEHFEPVRHCLIAHKNATNDSITYVYSHREALAQCKEFIRAHKYTAVPFGDTAGAVEFVSGEARADIAALASARAATLYPHVRILKRNVQDNPDNVTRFLVVARRAPLQLPKKDCITSLMYEVKDIPAALFKSLAGFATAGTNIIKLESFVPMQAHNQAFFYIEFEGSPLEEPHKTAMKELAHYAKEVRVLGTYTKSSYRKHFLQKKTKK